MSADKSRESSRELSKGRSLQAERLESLGALTGNLAWDLSGQLNRALLEVEQVLDEVPSDSAAYQRIHDVEDKVQSALMLVEQVLACTAEPPLVSLPFELSAVLGSMGQLLEISLPESVELRLNLGRNLPRVAAAESYARQLVLKMTETAVATLPGSGGRVILSTGAREYDRDQLNELGARRMRPGTCVYLSAVGDGAGAEDEEGVGVVDEAQLPILQALADTFYGHVRWTRKNGRSVWTVLIPTIPESASDPRAHLAPGWHPGGKVLLVEPDAKLQKSLTGSVEKLGFETVHAPDADRAREVLDANDVVLALVDVDNTTDWESLTAGLPENVPLLLTCAWGSQATAPDKQRLIHKPVRLARFREVVAQLLDLES